MWGEIQLPGALAEAYPSSELSPELIRKCKQSPLSPLQSTDFSLDTDISSFLLSLCLSVHLSTHPLAQPGLPPLLSLLLCVIPSKAIHLTYEPTWQLPTGEPPRAPNSASSLSFFRQVMAPLGATSPLPSGIH